MTHDGWACPKCGHEEFDVDEVRTAGGAVSAIFDLSNKKFTSVTCSRCRYTEFYRTSSSNLEQVLDFFAT